MSMPPNGQGYGQQPGQGQQRPPQQPGPGHPGPAQPAQPQHPGYGRPDPRSQQPGHVQSGYGQTGAPHPGYGQPPQQGGGFGQPAPQQRPPLGQPTSGQPGYGPQGPGQHHAPGQQPVPPQHPGPGQAAVGFLGGQPPSGQHPGAWQGGQPQPSRSARPWYAQWWLWTAVGVVVIAGGLVIGEFVARGNVTSALQEQADAIVIDNYGEDVAPSEYTVTVDGFSVLAQLAAGKIGHATIVSQGDGGVDVGIDLTGIDASLEGPVDTTRVDLSVATEVLDGIPNSLKGDEAEINTDNYETTISYGDDVISIEAVSGTGEFQVKVNSDLGYETSDGKLYVTNDSTMTLFGTSIPFGSQDKIEVPTCDGSSLEAQVTDASISSESISFSWYVDGAELTELPSVADCL